MKKELKDYLHLYLGCECYVEWGAYARNGILEWCGKKYAGIGFAPSSFIPIDNIKPILHPLSDMTEDECNEYNRLSDMVHRLLNKVQDQIETEAHRNYYLLSKHFDLFGLIDAGLAIDATTIKKN